MESEHIKRIVVFAPNKKFFGANVLQIPFFQHIRRGFPNARITIWSPEKASAMMVNLDLADELEIYGGWKDYLRIYLDLLKIKPDIVFNLRWFSEGMNFLTGISMARVRIGFNTSSPFRFLLNGRVQRNDSKYMALLYLDLLKPAGIRSLFYFEGIGQMDAGSKLRMPDGKMIICLMPGGGEGEHKRWGIDNFCNLGRMIVKRFPHAWLVFVLGPQEAEFAGTISGHFQESAYMILLNGSLEDVVRVSKRSRITIANDCGPSHIAQMVGANYVGIWGWKNQHPLERIIKWTYPRPNAVHVVAEQDADIKQVSPEEVYRVVRGFLQPD